MKKSALLVLSAGLVLGGLTVTPAVAADPAPADVKISWKDDSFEFIRVTWTDTGAQPNRVFVRKVGSAVEKFAVHVAADGENVVDLRKDIVSDYGNTNGTLEVGVAVGTAEGLTSPVAVSAAFDTYEAGTPRLVSWAGSGTSTLHVKWAAAPVGNDSTPNDPLDRTEPVRFDPRFKVAGGQSMPAGATGPATELTFTGPNPPYEFYVLSENEWFTGNPSQSVRAGQTKFTASIPTWAVAGTDTVIRGTYSGPQYVGATLQARNSATSPWYAVTSYTNLTDGTFEFRLPSRGTREYRVAFANIAATAGPAVWFGGFTQAVTTTTQQKAIASLGAPSTVAGSRVPAYLSVLPEVSGTAQLQRWSGSAWTVVGNVTLTNGNATGIIHQTTVGSTAYRYYVPAHTFNGLGVAAAYSNQFVLTTTR